MNEVERIEACLRGNGEEFRDIVVEYQGPLTALAMNMLGNRQEAEDACQDAFIRAFRSLERFDRTMSFRNWIFTILYRRCLDLIKRKKRFRIFFARAVSDPLQSYCAQASDPFSNSKLSRRVMDRLSPKERLAAALWANEGLTAAEIAGVLGCAASTARVHLFNARKKIKVELEKGHETLGNL